MRFRLAKAEDHSKLRAQVAVAVDGCLAIRTSGTCRECSSVVLLMAIGKGKIHALRNGE